MTSAPLRDVVARRWPLPVVAVLLVGVLVTVVALVSTDRYRATAVVTVRPDATSPGSWQVVGFLLPQLRAEVGSAGLRQEVASLVGSAGAGWSLSAEVEPGTAVLRVSAEGPRRDDLAALADRAAAVLVERHAADTALDLAVVDPARRPADVALAVRPSLLAGGWLLALVLGCLVAPLGAARHSGSARVRSAT